MISRPKTQARDVESAVKLASGIPNVTAVDKHTPSRQTVLKNNLVTYYVHYRSCFGQEARRIKVDFLYDLGMNYDTRIMPAGKGIVGVKIPHDMEILARSSLMADKGRGACHRHDRIGSVQGGRNCKTSV